MIIFDIENVHAMHSSATAINIVGHPGILRKYQMLYTTVLVIGYVIVLLNNEYILGHSNYALNAKYMIHRTLQ